jgi:hypothetical protein
MAADALLDLMARAGISFTGTVQQPGAHMPSGFVADARTVVVRVDQVLHAHSALTG